MTAITLSRLDQFIFEKPMLLISVLLGSVAFTISLIGVVAVSPLLPEQSSLFAQTGGWSEQVFYALLSPFVFTVLAAICTGLVKSFTTSTRLSLLFIALLAGVLIGIEHPVLGLIGAIQSLIFFYPLIRFWHQSMGKSLGISLVIQYVHNLLFIVTSWLVNSGMLI